MIETPADWLADLFEYETCAECGGDSQDHEVCLVPGMGTFFARCLRPDKGDGWTTPATREPTDPLAASDRP